MSGRWRRFWISPASILGLLICGGFLVVALFAPHMTPHPPDEMALMNRHLPPSSVHWFGTDFYGRDVLSRVIMGSRITLAIGVVALLVQAAVGVSLGLLAGHFGGVIDIAVMRVTDIFMSFPTILLALAIMAVSGGGFWNLILALTIKDWTSFARIVRSQVMSLRNRDFVAGAIALGAGHPRVMVRHLLPNCLAVIIVHSTLALSIPILAESSLSFLGLGLPIDSASWGSMAAVGRAYMRNAWWAVTFPGLAITAVVLGTNLLGDALRDALDPRLGGH